jgi:hypothetical protein
MDFDLRELDEYFASSGAGSDPYITLFPEGKVSGLARDSVGSISKRNAGVEDRGFKYLQQPVPVLVLKFGTRKMKVSFTRCVNSNE